MYKFFVDPQDAKGIQFVGEFVESLDDALTVARTILEESKFAEARGLEEGQVPVAAVYVRKVEGDTRRIRTDIDYVAKFDAEVE